MPDLSELAHLAITEKHDSINAPLSNKKNNISEILNFFPH